MAKRVGLTFVGVALAFATADVARADWWSENFELHGKATSNVYFNSPSLSKDFQMDQWMNTVEMNFDIKLYTDSDTSLTFHSIITPTYDAVYDIYPKYFGDRRKGAAEQTQSRFANPLAPFGAANSLKPITQTQTDFTLGVKGDNFDGHGAHIEGGSTDANQDTGFIFTGGNNPQMPINNVVFFGTLGGATRTRGTNQGKVGGTPSLDSFGVAKKLWESTGATPGTSNFLASLAMSSGSKYAPLHSFNPAGNTYVIGNRRSLEQQHAVGLNHTDGQMSTRCFDGVHDWCWAREAYFEFKYEDTQLRIGRQQVVWGKTDAFRLQDLVNPIDFSSHNVYPSLEERRIPSLSVDLVHSFGTVGPLEDFSLELVWVFDKFKPVQVGQCGDFWAFTAACEARADASGHGLLNVSAAKVEERKWTFANTEPGFRFEFRIPDPSIAFSLSGFWGIQDAPVARFENHYKTNSPNPAMMLFLQSIGFDPFIPAFDPFNQASILASSNAAKGLWESGFNIGFGPLCDFATLTTQEAADCIGGKNAIEANLQPLGWMWGSSQAVLEYPRTFTLGGSLDYQIPNIDTVLRLESAYDFNRTINDTDEQDGINHSDVLLAAIGLDRSFFIPWLNKDRTAFVSVQTFVEHVLNYNGGNRQGMVVPETNVISTFFIENYWRGDSIVLTNFFAYDWNAKAWITGPKLKWVMNDKISFEVGVNLLQGSKKTHNIRDLCSDGTLSCISDPDSWQSGNWQIINAGFDRNAEAPFWNLESFADTIMESRDEVWAGVTYQF